MGFSKMCKLSPVGQAFHHVSEERWKQLSDDMQILEQSLQELFKNMTICQQAHSKVMSTFCETGKQESIYPVPRVRAQAVRIKTEVEETQLPTKKRKLEANQNYPNVGDVKVEKMEFKEEQIDEDTFPMNLMDEMDPEGEKSLSSEIKSAGTCKETDNNKQNSLKSPPPKVHAQVLPIKKELEETQLPTSKKVAEENHKQNCLESLNLPPKVHAQAVAIKKEFEETQQSTIKKVVGENKIYPCVNEMKVEEFREEQVDEDMCSVNLMDEINPEGEKNAAEMNSVDALKGLDKNEQNSHQPKVHLQVLPIKKEFEETQLPVIKKEIEENQNHSSLTKVKFHEMEFKAEQIDEDTFPMNLMDEMISEEERNSSVTSKMSAKSTHEASNIETTVKDNAPKVHEASGKEVSGKGVTDEWKEVKVDTGNVDKYKDNFQWTCKVCNEVISGAPTQVSLHAKSHMDETPDKVSEAKATISGDLDTSNNAYENSATNVVIKTGQESEEPHQSIELEWHKDGASDMDRSANQTKENEVQENIELEAKVENKEPSMAEEVNDISTNSEGTKRRNCYQCSKAFKSYWCLQQHERTHNGNKPFGCSKCDKTFSQKGNAKTHEKQCKQSIVDTSSSAAATISKSSPETESNESDISQKIETSVTAVKSGDEVWKGESKSQDPKPEVSFVCKTCGDHFNDPSELQSHQLKHFMERPFGCRICDDSFATASELSSHILSHTTPDVKPFTCKTCNMAFIKLQDMKDHEETHTAKTDSTPPPSQIANQAKADTSSSSEEDNSKQKPYSCDTCGRAFRKKFALKKHLKSHAISSMKTEAEKRVHECPECPLSFNNKKSLSTHMRTHNGLKTYKCDSCGKEFSQIGSLKRHEIKFHGIVKPNNVDIKTGQESEEPHQSIELEWHRDGASDMDRSANLTKENEVQEKIELEAKVKNKEPSLVEVVDNVSTNSGGTKRRNCNQCGKIFKNTWSLRQHERTHRGNMTIVGMADHLCKDAEFRLQNTFQIKTNLQEADEKTKAQIIANLLYVYNTSWQLESVPVLVGNHSAKVSSLSDPKITKKDVSQIRSWCNFIELGHLVPRHPAPLIPQGDPKKYLQLLQTLMAKIDVTLGAIKLNATVRQLAQKHNRQAQSRKPTTSSGNARNLSNVSVASSAASSAATAATQPTAAWDTLSQAYPGLTVSSAGKENKATTVASSTAGGSGQQPKTNAASSFIPSGRQLPRSPNVPTSSRTSTGAMPPPGATPGGLVKKKVGGGEAPEVVNLDDDDDKEVVVEKQGGGDGGTSRDVEKRNTIPTGSTLPRTPANGEKSAPPSRTAAPPPNRPSPSQVDRRKTYVVPPKSTAPPPQATDKKADDDGDEIMEVNKPFGCSKCNKGFSKNRRKKTHEKQCKQSVADTSSSAVAMISKSSPETKSNESDISQKIETSVTAVMSRDKVSKGESKSQDPKPEVSFVCKTCGDHFNNTSELQSHQLKHFLFPETFWHEKNTNKRSHAKPCKAIQLL